MSDKLVELAAASKSSSTHIDTSALAEALRAQVRGDVRFDRGSRALYATDGSNYRQVPIGVVLPRDTDDVLATVALCREFGAPLLCRGGGTSLAGQCCNVAVILDFSKYMAGILEIDPARRIARVQPGVVLDNLRSAAEKHHLTFAPDPATHDRCTLGGMIGNNSCGVHSVMGGKTDDNIEELEVLTYDGARMRVGATPNADLERICASGGRRGEIYSKLQSIASFYGDLVRQRFPNIPRRVSGYNLNYLLPENGFHVARALVGSEGTCVTILEATCRLVESPPQRVLLVVAYPDIYQCADNVPEIMKHKPIGLEGFDDLLVDYTRARGINSEGMALLPEGGGWLMVEFGADAAMEAESQARGLMQALGRVANPPNLVLFTDQRQIKRVWEVRESALGVTSHVPGEPLSWEGWEDSAVAPEKLGGYLRDLRKMFAAYGYKGSLYGHFGHGCVHTRINFDLQSEEGIAKFRKFMEEAADLVVSYGGSISGEHGDGQSRAELLPKMFGPELVQAFREFKAAWDPEWKMNPGKLIEPYPLDENLRLGAAYAPWEPETNFRFAADHGSLAEATLRCVGVGKCRREEGGLMCPSYRVTHEEEQSTRGRAHLLWEMTQGEVIRDGWRSEEVKKSLDLCLACKGCKSDCPVGVDVATYKSEFLSHYYEGRVRTRSTYAFGNIDLWARVASHAPGLVNLTTQLPFLRNVAKVVAGIPKQRSIPAFAPESFKTWFCGPRRILGKRAAQNGFGWRSASSAAIEAPHDLRALAPEAPPVLLWPDTFNNYFHPQTAQAAVDVLEAAGFRVVVPRANLCCGRPLYDHGMLDRAQALLLRILDELSPEIEAGIPIVGLEPSCVAVFRDELVNLFPHDERAHALSRQTFLLSEFLETHAKDFPLPQFKRKALLHGHCHHKSIMKMTAEEAVLHRLGIDFQSPAPGCCGMAGSFGFEAEKYEISVAIGELELLPAVRKAPANWLVIADGFSCREQIAQSTNRQALHLAEVLQMALVANEDRGDTPECEPYPESTQAARREAAVFTSMARAGLGLVAVVAGGALLWEFSKKH
ncbi:MAG TPA: FAD-linked oxidase C-terminal domain-containing protein [Candidatus Dormibacteraeota bacterium]|jgi:FAD/FMN-containing dehydrogenase/Fe-S oxidoreductase|nr:FAD-linked oxidase C-terminal domain-containing protein [Candidatus Dormibacteraeota bacterium]